MPPKRVRNTRTAPSTGPATAPARCIARNPYGVAVVRNYVLPAAGATLAGPLISVLPLGPLGPTVALLLATYSRFCLRANVVGSLYAGLRSLGLSGVRGQLLTLLSFLSMGSVMGAGIQSQLLNLVLAAGGHQAHLIGLILSMLTGLAGCFGMGPIMLRGSSINAIVGEFRSFAIFRGTGWLLDTIEDSWRRFLSSQRGAPYLRMLGYSRDRARTSARRAATWRTLRNTAWDMVDRIGFRGLRAQQRTSSPDPEPEPLDEWIMVEEENF
ncbi:hypothetical protein BS50DRAFT_675320 [Corynespora cassiicola Philippines]|uniref:Uncharacterized protein n=1 Tax=Corynespora cassiicola Philippines TaxID=1448308 RepID=A0A2T2NUM8_CORCC|nr:hypothetical protein BS50DRAFT_675320 [Corynespora cassiicola Philippines]